MHVRRVTAAPSQIMVEQLAASGVKFVFNNPGSLEALFFDALHAHPAQAFGLVIRQFAQGGARSNPAIVGGVFEERFQPVQFGVRWAATGVDNTKT